MDQMYARNPLRPVLVSGDADIIRASQHQHAVEDLDRHNDFSRSTLVYTRAQAVVDHLFPSPDDRLDGSALTAARGLLSKLFCQAE